MITQFQNAVQQILSNNSGLQYDRIQCTSQWVSNDIAVPFNCKVDSLNSNSAQLIKIPILINAPTGSGKSTFVFEKLVEDAQKSNCTILILSNRTTLSIQQKKILSNKLKLFPQAIQQLNERYFFGNAAIFTYQSVLQHFDELNYFCSYFPLKYIVFDEVHFFCSDAVFNANTETILCKLGMAHPQATRIYMSATPEAVKPVLSAYEFLFQQHRVADMLRFDPSWVFHAKIIEYYFQRNFDNISLHFFEDWPSISTRIEQEEEPFKWLIFVSDKEEGRNLYKQLGKARAYYIDASAALKKDSVIQQLTLSESFNRKVLITTSVIDNGINIDDSDLTRIVIDFPDETQLIQMLGRKRRSPDEHIDLFIKVPTIQLIRNYFDKTQRQLQLLDEVSLNPINYLLSHWG